MILKHYNLDISLLPRTFSQACLLHMLKQLNSVTKKNIYGLSAMANTCFSIGLLLPTGHTKRLSDLGSDRFHPVSYKI